LIISTIRFLKTFTAEFGIKNVSNFVIYLYMQILSQITILFNIYHLFSFFITSFTGLRAIVIPKGYP
ncbi:MAG: hypothetical protein KDC25_14355, partial [Saprospiraceae bacterium]|nr:hypothetical protein [Saprospiraceae bacterium]